MLKSIKLGIIASVAMLAISPIALGAGRCSPSLIPVATVTPDTVNFPGNAVARDFFGSGED